MLLLLLLLLAAAPLTRATLLASSRLEACTESGAAGTVPLTRCAQRLVVTLSVQGGENASEAVTGASLRTAVDAAGGVYDLLDTVEISLAKTPIRLRYPLTYLRQVNARPYELVRTADLGGRAFNWLTNPCIDDPLRYGACGWVTTAAGARVPGSNGFCCRCDADAYLSPGGSASRAGLQCNLLDSSSSQSAHCLRMGPLWYSAFAVGPPSVQYEIDVVMKRCVSAPEHCLFQLARLSPSQPGLCRDLPALDPATGAPLARDAATGSNNNNATPCDVWASLEGDFAAYASAPELSAKTLMVPGPCEAPAVCGNRTTESAERWLLVDTARTTAGSECNKVGVAHSGFQGQGSRCAVPAGSCLQHQLEDLYLADAATDAAGGVGSSFVKFHGHGGVFLPPSLASASSASITYETRRLQRSVVTLYLSADSLRYVQRVVEAVIARAGVPTFEALTRTGSLGVTVVNTASVAGLVTVSVACGGGIDVVPSQQLSLGAAGGAGAAANLTFALHATSAAGGVQHVCSVSVVNGLFRETDRRSVAFNTTAAQLDAGEQGGSPGPGAPGASSVERAGGAGGASCEERCPNAWDPVCALANKCVARLASWSGGLAGLLAGVVLLAKFPFLLTVPARGLGVGVLGVLRLLRCLAPAPRAPPVPTPPPPPPARSSHGGGRHSRQRRRKGRRSAATAEGGPTGSSGGSGAAATAEGGGPGRRGRSRVHHHQLSPTTTAAASRSPDGGSGGSSGGSSGGGGSGSGGSSDAEGSSRWEPDPAASDTAHRGHQKQRWQRQRPHGSSSGDGGGGGGGGGAPRDTEELLRSSLALMTSLMARMASSNPSAPAAAVAGGAHAPLGWAADADGARGAGSPTGTTMLVSNPLRRAPVPTRPARVAAAAAAAAAACKDATTAADVVLRPGSGDRDPGPVTPRCR